MAVLHPTLAARCGGGQPRDDFGDFLDLPVCSISSIYVSVYDEVVVCEVVSLNKAVQRALRV